MNRTSLLYGLVGLLAGSTLTASAILLTAKTSPPAAKIASQANPTESLTATLVQATPVNTVTPVPYRPRMMGMGHSDPHFIIMMIPHHQGAVAMADLALKQAKHPEIKQLAQTIKTTQTQEIEQMRTWYKQWYGTDVPTWQPGMGRGMMQGWKNLTRNQQSPNSPPGWGMGMGMGCPGMMGTDLSVLQNAPDFDRAFIRLLQQRN